MPWTRRLFNKAIQRCGQESGWMDIWKYASLQPIKNITAPFLINPKDQRHHLQPKGSKSHIVTESWETYNLPRSCCCYLNEKQATVITQTRMINQLRITLFQDLVKFCLKCLSFYRLQAIGRELYWILETQVRGGGKKLGSQREGPPPQDPAKHANAALTGLPLVA